MKRRNEVFKWQLAFYKLWLNLVGINTNHFIYHLFSIVIDFYCVGMDVYYHFWHSDQLFLIDVLFAFNGEASMFFERGDNSDSREPCPSVLAMYT